MKYLIFLFLPLLIGCAIPSYHFDTDQEWIDRKEQAFTIANAPWMPSNNNKQLFYPYTMIEYFGHENQRITFSNVQRIDYFYGYIYVRRDPNTINPFIKYIPFGIFSFESYGVIGSNKEWLSRPSLPAFVITVGMTTVSSIFSVGFIAPTRVWEEETFHASQEILHPSFTKVSGNIMYWLTLQPVPIVKDFLSGIFYYIHPMEVDAKIKKWIYSGWTWNLDCNAAWNRYHALIAQIAAQRCREEGKSFKIWEPSLAYHALLNGYEIDSEVYKMAKKYKGLVVRLPYEQKMVYSPWVHGIMREEKELPWFTRTFIVPIFGEVGNK